MAKSETENMSKIKE